MQMRNDPEQYGFVTKALHWLMFGALTAQFVVGYSLHGADLLEGVVERWFDGDEERLLPIHVAIGVSILVLAVLRVVWRASGTLPAWADSLTAAERRVIPWVERTMYWLMFLVPITGLGLVLASGEDWDVSERGEWQAPWELADDDLLLGAHITAQVMLLAAVAVHVGIVLRHQIGRGDRLLNRML